MLLTYVRKVDKSEVRRLYVKHIHMFLLFLVFVGELPLCCQGVKVTNFGSYPLFEPLDQANLICF